jgi:tetratricopeptide (TPR) repeat protein
MTVTACDALTSSGGAPVDRKGEAAVSPGEQVAASGAPGGEATKKALADEGGAATSEPVASKLAKADRAALDKTRQTLLRTLNAGRVKVKSGDYAGGVAEFEALLKIDPHHGAALGELGWAEFKRGSLVKAHARTLRAITLARDDKARGMLLYNLGRIAEAREQPAVAAAHYELSLTLRANNVVRARLAAVKGALTETASQDADKKPSLLPVMKAGFATTDELCTYLKEESMCYSETCEQVAPVADAPDYAMFAVGEGIMNCWHPALRRGGTWTLFDAVLFSQYGREVDQEVDSLTSRASTTPEGVIVVYDYKEHIYERNWDSADLESLDELPDDDMMDSAGIILCDAALGACSTRLIHTYQFAAGDGARAMAFKATFSFTGATLMVSHVNAKGNVLGGRPDDYLDGEQLLSAGEHRIADLITRGL